MYNESENIEDTVARITDLAKEVSADYEIIIVDDASTDGCGDIVDGLAAKDRCIKSIRLKKNTKFGGALKEGLAKASKDVVLYTDSDFPAKEEDIKKALELLGSADIVTAYSLVIKDASFKRIVMSKVYNFFVRLLFGFNLKDINSGLKIYKKEVLNGMNLISQSPFVDAEIFAEAFKRRYKVKQYGLIFDLRTKGTSRISRLDIVARTFWDMLVYKFKR